MNATEAIRRMRAAIRRQHKSMTNEDSFVHWPRHYTAWLSEMPQTLSIEQKLERFLTELALKRDVAALHALRPVYLSHASTLSKTRTL